METRGKQLANYIMASFYFDYYQHFLRILFHNPFFNPLILANEKQFMLIAIEKKESKAFR